MKFKKMLQINIFGGILITTAALLSAAPSQVVLTPDSKLWLIGDSSLHAYTSTASEFNMTMEAGTPLFESIQSGKMKTLEVHVPVMGLKSGKGQLDRNMIKALKGKENPEIIFKMDSYEVLNSTAGTSFPLIAKGSLTVAGQTKSVEIDALVTAGDIVRIEGKKELLMTDFGVKPPTILMIKTRNNVFIHFDLRATR